MIFPNLFIAEIQVFNIQPVSVERVHPVLDRGAIGRRPGTQPADGVPVRRIGRAGGHAAGRRHRDVRAQPGGAARADARMARRAPRSEP